ncbi:ferritin-like domain-containing protein [Frondihabitans peucedani]|uniref:Ferritin-like domain-containing protein n=1 Tax=Frondihabitans peucedani TaxID=598626 RepID=A0ABP8E0C8_9MICO
MFDKRFITKAIGRSAENPLDRRRFLAAAGVTGVGVGAAVLASGAPAMASTAKTAAYEGEVTDSAILNFALNLEYLEAEFYLRAVTGTGLPSSMIDGIDPQGGVVGGHKVPFKTGAIKSIATEIAADEKAHVAFLRAALGGAKVSRPAIDLKSSFNAAAVAAGLIKPGQSFDPFASEENFLLGAFIFEDVGVTAYKGAAPLITNKTYLGAAAGILAVEAYHAGIIRDRILSMGLYHQADAISAARDSLDGKTDDDQGVVVNNVISLVPTDANSIAYGRTAERVLNVVYLNPNQIDRGGFFPAGVNGAIVASGNPGSPTA